MFSDLLLTILPYLKTSQIWVLKISLGRVYLDSGLSCIVWSFWRSCCHLPVIILFRLQFELDIPHWCIAYWLWRYIISRVCQEQVIAILSHKFCGPAARWRTIEQVAFEIYFGVKKLEYLLKCKSFVVEPITARYSTYSQAMIKIISYTLHESRGG